MYLHEIKFKDTYQNFYTTTCRCKHIMHKTDVERLTKFLIEDLPNNKVQKHTFEMNVKEE